MQRLDYQGFYLRKMVVINDVRVENRGSCTPQLRRLMTSCIRHDWITCLRDTLHDLTPQIVDSGVHHFIRDQP